LCADTTTRESLPLALEAYQAVRQPYGNRLVLNARLSLREFQYNGPNGSDMMRIKENIGQIFEESARVGGSGPEADAEKAISWLKGRVSEA
jgi:salicylate hydroxylase